MSDNHKRPLLAFVLVALACSLIIANGVRTQAVVSAVHTGAQHLVAGVELVLTDEAHKPARASRTAPELTPVGPVEVAAQQLFGGGPSVQPDGHRNTHVQKTKAHHTHSRSQEKQRGHSDRAHGRGHGHDKLPGKGHAKKLDEVLDEVLDKIPGKVLDKVHTKSHGKAHTKSHGKSHTKSHGKSRGKGH